MHQLNLAKIIGINSNIGGVEPSLRFQARCLIEGLTDLTLGLERLQILRFSLTHARTDPT